MQKNIKVINGLGDEELRLKKPRLGVGDDSPTSSYLRKFRKRSVRYKKLRSKRIFINSRGVN